MAPDHSSDRRLHPECCVRRELSSKTPGVSMRMKSMLMITPGNRTLARVEGCRSIFSRQGAKTLSSELMMRL